MGSLKPLDHFTFTGNVLRNFSCGYSEDDRIFIQTELGVYVVCVRANLQSTFKYFSRKNAFFRPSSYTPCACVGMDVNNFAFDLDKDDLYRTMLRSELSATMKGAKAVVPVCLRFEWSPRGVVGGTECALAVRTNLNGLEVYVRQIDEHNHLTYVPVGNVTDFLVGLEGKSWKSGLRLPGPKVKLKEYTRRIEKVACTAFTWTHLYKIGDAEYCSICVGHYDGSLTFFKMESLENNSAESCSLEYLGRYSSNLSQISCLYWHQTRTYGGGLCLGDIDGRMSVINVSDLDKDVVFVDNETAFYTTIDKSIDAIEVSVVGEYTVVMLIKRCSIIFYVLNSAGRVIDCNIYDAKNFYITGLHVFEENLHVLTFSGSLRRLTLVIANDKLIVEEQIVPIKFDSARFRTHGLLVSFNKIIFGIVAFPCRITDRTNMKVHVFLYYDTGLKPFEILMENGSGYLTRHWDVFETLRLTSLKEQTFPWTGIDPDTNYDDLSVLQIKTLKHVAKLSESIFCFIPKIPRYDIKPHIILQYLLEIKLVTKRLDRFLHEVKSLSLFQLQSMDVQLFYLKEIVVKNILAKANVGKNFIDEVYRVVSLANEIKYPDPPQCFWCGEKIIGTSCVPPHSDSRCCYSFMPVDLSPGYFCPRCRSAAHEEISKELCPVLCPYCDIPMCRMRRAGSGAVPPVSDSCYSDCVPESLDPEDLEEGGEPDRAAVSSDGSEGGPDRAGLRELYCGVAGMSLEETGNVESEAGADREGCRSDLRDRDGSPAAKIIKTDK